MAAHTHDCITGITPAWLARRAEAGCIRLTQRDIDGLILAEEAEEYDGVPLDLPAAAFTPEQPR